MCWSCAILSRVVKIDPQNLSPDQCEWSRVVMWFERKSRVVFWGTPFSRVGLNAALALSKTALTPDAKQIFRRTDYIQRSGGWWTGNWLSTNHHLKIIIIGHDSWPVFNHLRKLTWLELQNIKHHQVSQVFLVKLKRALIILDLLSIILLD